MRRILSVSPKALRRRGVHIYLYMRAELLQLERVVSCYVAVQSPGSRFALAGRLEIPGRGFITYLLTESYK